MVLLAILICGCALQPQISGIYDVRGFGACGDGRTKDTAAMQAAHAAGGGEVRVFDPDGKLAFEKGAVLYWTRYVSPKAKSDGLWRIEFVKPSNGDMWGFYAEAAGVRPFFFLSPEKYWFSVSRGSRSSVNGVASVVETRVYSLSAAKPFM